MDSLSSDQRARRRANLARLLKPKSIAFIGGGYLEECINLTRRAGFDGQLYAVNPKRETLGGIQCAASIADLPEAPDAAFV